MQPPVGTERHNEVALSQLDAIISTPGKVLLGVVSMEHTPHEARLDAMKALNLFRLVGFLEGMSFIVLLFVAMPMKYWLGLPVAVRIVGMGHGLLFLVFVVALFRVASERSWPLFRSALAFGASLVPFGTFFLDRELKRELANLALEG